MAAGKITTNIDSELALFKEIKELKAELAVQIDLCEGLNHDNAIFADELDRVKAENLGLLTAAANWPISRK